MSSTESLYNQSLIDEKEFTKAGPLNRIIAKIIDFIIVIALFEIMPYAGYFAGLLYLSLADGLFAGQSAGKKLMNLKVVLSRDGVAGEEACGYRESILRNLPFVSGYILFGILKVIPLLGWLFSLIILIAILFFEGLVMIGSDRGMRLGDELAKTQVVEEIKGE